MTEKELVAVCVDDDGCIYWTEGGRYPVRLDAEGNYFIHDDDRPGDIDWLLVRSRGTNWYYVPGSKYRARFRVQ